MALYRYVLKHFSNIFINFLPSDWSSWLIYHLKAKDLFFLNTLVKFHGVQLDFSRFKPEVRGVEYRQSLKSQKLGVSWKKQMIKKTLLKPQPNNIDLLFLTHVYIIPVTWWQNQNPDHFYIFSTILAPLYLGKRDMTYHKTLLNF